MATKSLLIKSYYVFISTVTVSILCFFPLGNIKLVEKFLEYKAEPNMKDSFGLTPIMLAAAKGEQNIVECLQVAGASLKVVILIFSSLFFC